MCIFSKVYLINFFLLTLVRYFMTSRAIAMKRKCCLRINKLYNLNESRKIQYKPYGLERTQRKF